MLTVIPFSGFYNSWHGDALDQAIQSMLSDDNGDPFDGLVALADERCDWRKVRVAYAKAYCENFAQYFEVHLQFDELNSPREYNFTTDRIFAHIPRDDVRRLRRKVSKSAFDAKAAEMFTSCSGFISHYSPDWGRWGHVDTWDHNQVFCLLSAYVDQLEGCFDQSRELDLMDYHRCNGSIECWISDAIPADLMRRLWRVCDYLRARQQGADGIRRYREDRRTWLLEGVAA